MDTLLPAKLVQGQKPDQLYRIGFVNVGSFSTETILAQTAKNPVLKERGNYPHVVHNSVSAIIEDN